MTSAQRIPAVIGEAVTEVSPRTLGDVRGLIGARTVEVVRLPLARVVLFVDEDGRPLGLPFNARASAAFGAFVFGVAVVASPKDARAILTAKETAR